jgi:glucokinase
MESEAGGYFLTGCMYLNTVASGLTAENLDTDAPDPHYCRYPRLLGDVGGTNARFAWAQSVGSPLSDIVTYPCINTPTLEAALKAYLSSHQTTQPIYCALGIANPIVGDLVQMTNHHWSFSISALQKSLGFRQLLVINDFSALALSLPSLRQEDLQQVGGGKAVSGAPLALLGPGTGLGVSGLMVASGSVEAINGEGGHVSLAANNEFESAIVQRLQKRFGHASAERALSGPGLVNLYRAVCDISDAVAEDLLPSEVTKFALRKSNAECIQALQLFFAFLGSVAGNLALTLGARGGVYLGGGILPRLLDELHASMFRQRFESKGRFQSYLSEIPTFVIDAVDPPALIGASAALDRAGQR